MYPDQNNPNQPQTPQPTPIPPQPIYGSNAGTPQQTYEALPPPTFTGHATGHNPYEFIVNPNTPNQRLPGQNKNFLLKVAVIVKGAVVLMIVAGIVISFTLPKGSTQGLKDIAERQQEIIRISAQASNKATGPDTQNFIANLQLSISSSQQTVIHDLGKNGVKLPAKELAFNKNPQTDTLLANALTAGTYDTAVVQNLTDQLKTYETLVQSTYTSANHATTKQILQNCFKSADGLLKQAKSLPTAN